MVLGVLRSFSLTLTRFGSLRSSKNRSRNSSFVRVKVNSSCPSPSAALVAAPAAAWRLGDLVADLVFLVARQHVVAPASVAAEREGGLAQALGANGDPLGAFRLGHPAGLERILDGLADLRLGTTEKPLAVAETLGFGI
jgi:hypothetical protein